VNFLWDGCEIQLLSEQRKQFIELVQKTYDVLDPTAAVNSVVEACPNLLAKTSPAPISVSVYTVAVPRCGVGLGDNFSKEDVGILFQAGAGNQEFVGDREKWRPGKPLEEILDLTLKMLAGHEAKPFRARAQSGKRALLLRTTESVFMLSFSYQGRAMGYLVAESSASPPRAIFTEDTCRLLRLIGMFLGLLIGRYRLLTDGLGSLLHQRIFISKIKVALSKLEIVARDGLALTETKAMHDLLQDCDEEFAAAYLTYEVASGKKHISVAPVQIVSVIFDATARFQRMLPEGAKPPIVFSPDGFETCSVYCNAIAVRSILFELLQNAWKYRIDNSMITIEIRKTESHINIAITNEISYHIPKQVSVRIFEAAFRWTPPETLQGEAVVGGTGLGLWQVKLLLEAQDGSIAFNNELHNQVTFTITLLTAEKRPR